MQYFLSFFCFFFSVSFVIAQGTWIQKTSLPATGRLTAVAFSIGNKGYLGTGFTTAGYANDFWEYDPSSDSWTQKANVGGSPRAYAVGFSIGNKGYIGSGWNLSAQSAMNDWWEYDPLTNIWMLKASVGGPPRYTAVGFSVGGMGPE